MLSKLGAALLPLVLAASACGSDDPTIGSCDTRDQGNQDLQGICRTWFGEETGDFQSLCNTQGGTYSGGRCPEEGLIATCVTDQGLGLGLTYYYYASDFDVDSARAHCESRSSCTLSCVFDEI